MAEQLRELQCLVCQKLMIRRSKDGEFRISSKVIKISPSGEHVTIVCKDCGHEQVVPVTFSMLPPVALATTAALPADRGAFRVLKVGGHPKRVKKNA